MLRQLLLIFDAAAAYAAVAAFFLLSPQSFRTQEVPNGLRKEMGTPRAAAGWAPAPLRAAGGERAARRSGCAWTATPGA